mgnify:CR=1 FL=1
MHLPDHDGDGDFNEPDGYIDHFQAIHAGEGEEAGGGEQGEDAIWSHRWYAFSNNMGKDGPAQNKLGGVPLGHPGLGQRPPGHRPLLPHGHNGGDQVLDHRAGRRAGRARPARGRSWQVARGAYP